MSDDIVERLKSPEVFIDHGGMFSPVAHVAADEITRLRAENERLREAVQLLISTQEEWERSVEKIIGKQPNIFLRAIDRARAALEGVPEKSGAGNE